MSTTNHIRAAQPRGTRAPKGSAACAGLLENTASCKFFIRGQCKKGVLCSFAHDKLDLRARPDLSRTKLCPALMGRGVCRDARCTFAHSRSELRRVPPRPQVSTVAVPGVLSPAGSDAKSLTGTSSTDSLGFVGSFRGSCCVHSDQELTPSHGFEYKLPVLLSGLEATIRCAVWPQHGFSSARGDFDAKSSVGSDGCASTEFRGHDSSSDVSDQEPAIVETTWTAPASQVPPSAQSEEHVDFESKLPTVLSGLEAAVRSAFVDSAAAVCSGHEGIVFAEKAW